ncbi:MAG: dihydrolipoyl dehydrogenase [Myxococcota bacterium]
MPETRYDLVVIGAGPGGYVCAIRAAQLGLKVACVEKWPTLGGTCLNVGCIPSKALLESSERFETSREHMAEHGVKIGDVDLDLSTMLGRKDDIVDKLVGGVEMLFKKNKIHWAKGFGRIRDAHTVVVEGEGDEEEVLEADAIVIATGSEPASLPGVDFDGERVVSSTEALTFEEVPERFVVVGAGVIGLELGSVWRRLGSEVTVLEYLDHILPGVDREIGKEAHKILTGQGLGFVTGAKVHTAEVGDDGVTLKWDDADGETHEIEADRVLVSIGRRPYTDGLGCEDVGIELDERGRIAVNGDYETSVSGIFAIGDATPGLMLAHKASDEGIAVAELLAGHEGHVNYDAIPTIIYTHPEIAGVGRTEEELKDEGVPYRKGKFRYVANGRALGLGETEGQVKILAHADTDRILGCHIVGARAGDLIAEIAVAVEFGASAEDIARSVHAHPTLAEIVREAAFDVDRRAIHK